MSDTPQGPDWWQAVDGRWYPPPSGVPRPYERMPAATPGSGDPNRRALLVTAGVLVAIIGVVLVAALASGGGDGGESQAGPSTAGSREPVTTRAEEDTEPRPETTEPPDVTARDEPAGSVDVSALEVVDYGFSTYTDPLGDVPGGSFGFLVENTGDDTIVGAPLSVTILDEAGGTIETANFTVGVIRPGETLGYGAELIEHPSNGIGDIAVQVGESIATYEVPTDGELTTSNISTSSDENSTTTTFSVSSTYSDQVDYAEPFAIYRDANGNIVGGGNGIMDFIPAGGQQTGEVHVFAAIPNIADTEVYVDPGPFY